VGPSVAQLREAFRSSGPATLAVRSGDYFVVTRPHGRPPVWTWEIQRRPKPLGVKLSGGDFKTESAAKLAGEKALAELLARLADEEKNAS
jgi:hypothetical protein